ncbi:hypothetical protein BH09ACT12_BH09ACT12_11100 [soil metagenome]
MELPELYRDIVENSPDSIWVTDLHGRTQYANDAFCRLYGVPRDQIHAVTVFDTLDDVGKLQFAEHLRRVRSGEPNQEDVEVLFNDAHGNATWISLRESLLYADGVVVAILNRLTSYGDRRHVLDELRASREALQEAQSLARLGSWVYDAATDRVEMLGGEPMFGPIESSTGAAAFAALVHPDDIDEVWRTTRDALSHPGEFEMNLRMAAGDGWVHLRVRGFVHASPDGAPVKVTGTHQDVTEMREVEMALRDEVVQSALMRQVAAAANAAHSVEEVLDLVLSLFLSHGTWIRSSAFRVDESGALVKLDPDVLPEEEELCRAALVSDVPIWSEDGRSIGLRVGTRERTFGVGTLTAAAPPTRVEMVEVMAAAIAVQLARVAEREESGRALADARDAAMAASRQKSEFLATMSHEIRTPLNGIIGLTDLLKRTQLDPDQQRLTSGMQAASHTLLTVLNDVLDFSKLDGRPVELEHVDVDVRAMVEQVARVLSGAAHAGGVELIVWCEADVPALVLGDPTRLSQVLMNLVSNAVKFSSGGEVLIRVSTTDPQKDGVGLQFDVADTGIGIEAEQLERLFEPFTQADASTTRRFGGTGLGLSIAREIVTALGGEISYAPNPGGGSVFSFSVICEPHPEGTTDFDEYARTWLAGRRVLVADGSALRVPALLEQLRWWRVEVDAAEDVTSARALLARSVSVEQPYEAVLIDARLDGGGGMVLIGDIAGNATYDAIAMIVIGSDLEVDLGRLRELGVSAFLDRPVSAEALRSTMLDQLVGVPAQPMGRPEADTHPSHLPRVLVVEDNVVNQLVASGMLSSLGYRSGIAQNGAEALDVLARESFDAVLMDVQMPVLDGYAATRTLREREAEGTHVPVIAMTAAAVEGERERCLAAGMDEFLTKPVDRAALAKVLTQWIAPGKDPMTDNTHGSGLQLPPTEPMMGLDTERLDMLRDLDPGDTTYIDRAIGNFQVNSLAAESVLGELVADGDSAGLKAAAHKIAGSALNLGVPRAGEAARALEHLADTGTTIGGESLMTELREAMAEGRALLLAYQATYAL